MKEMGHRSKLKQKNTYSFHKPELLELLFEVFKIPFLPILLVLEGSSIFCVLMISILNVKTFLGNHFKVT